MASLRPETAFLAAITVICVAVELLLSAGDWGLLGSARLRLLVYEYFAFWPGLLGGWQPNYAAQPWLMFVTYGFLHGGPVHLTFNMVTLWSLGPPIANRCTAMGLAAIYVGSMLAGALAYAFLAVARQPMVGASGALFGLAGAILALLWQDRARNKDIRKRVIRAMLFLIGLNAAMWWSLGGHLAWQTHLGGFIAGWLLAGPFDRWAERRLG